MSEKLTRFQKLMKVAEELVALRYADPEFNAKFVKLQRAAQRAQVLESVPMPHLKKARKAALVATMKKGEATAKVVKPHLNRLRKAGFTTYNALAEQLNKEKIKAPRGGAWSASSVRMVDIR